ncbi:hypothetical protein PIB30_024004 [Stylosanthes scabra]|uniref:Uncharacterized protein n=1 Tax=Stylosanthes scabra TaxID=79078 RepID=A0ABU6Z776_9FABA|nr:hypothetical protein [Stylosanthes scabra]
MPETEAINVYTEVFWNISIKHAQGRADSKASKAEAEAETSEARRQGCWDVQTQEMAQVGARGRRRAAEDPSGVTTEGA